MKKLTSIIGLAAMLLALSTHSQTNAPLPRPVETAFGWLQGATSITNWTIAGYGSFAENGSGAGVLALYNPTPYVGVGLGGDYFLPTDVERGDFTMTSGNLSLQLPIQVGPATVTPFTIGGIGIPLGGAGDNNGDTALIGGTGVAVGFQITERLKMSIGYSAVFWENTGANDGWRHCPTLSFRWIF